MDIQYMQGMSQMDLELKNTKNKFQLNDFMYAQNLILSDNYFFIKIKKIGIV